MFAVGGLLAVVQAGGVLLMPPSPRFYVLCGKYRDVSSHTSNVLLIQCFLVFFETKAHFLKSIQQAAQFSYSTL